MGEITYPDGYRVLVPQPIRPFNLSDAYVLSGALPSHDEVLRSITDTSEWGLSFTGVMDALDKAPQSHAEGRTGEPAAPVWAIAMIFAGLVLMAIGWLLNDPITQLIYGAIHAK
jgi:hypothetical protein